MNKDLRFGYRNWFIKSAIYEMLLREKECFGIDSIVYKKNIEIDEEKKNIRYKLCNIVREELIGQSINSTDIMAVLYKIDFTIVKGGRLDNVLQYREDKEEYRKIAFEESLRLAREEGYEV